MALIDLPRELRELPNWCVSGRCDEQEPQLIKAPWIWAEGHWQLVDAAKPKYLWTFDQACRALAANPDRQIGFILTDGCGMTCIDLDIKEDSPVDLSAKHAAFVSQVDTYTEVSASGVGYHLWLKGSITGALKTVEMEVYSRERFIICTGNVVVDAPAVFDADFLNSIDEHIAATNAGALEVVSQPQTMSDEDVFAKIMASDHSGKFAAFMHGDWNGYCAIMQSQGAPAPIFNPSDADMGAFTIITFHTQNHDQACRIWRMTALADPVKRYRDDPAQLRAKAKNVGTPYKLARVFNRAMQKNALDRARVEQQSGIAKELAASIMARPVQDRIALSGLEPLVGDMPYPPGMLGEMARYFEGCSIKRVREFAIAEALAVAAGMCGRAFNVGTLGLNLYMMVLAPSGTGKSALSSNPEALMKLMYEKYPLVNFRQFISTRAVSHGNTLMKSFKVKSSYCQCMSEAGKVLSAMTSDSNNGPNSSILERMVDVFDKSGWRKSGGGLDYTDADKSVEIDYPVAYSFLGESVPGPFFECITPTSIIDGFVSRFMVMEYRGAVPYDTPDDELVYEPSRELESHLLDLGEIVCDALRDIAHAKVTNVVKTNEVSQWLDAFGEYCTDQMNAHPDDGVVCAVWNRFKLKVMTIAGLVAAVNCPTNPVMTMGEVMWAKDFVNRHNHLIVNSVKEGRVVVTQSAGLDVLLNALDEYACDTNLVAKDPRKVGKNILQMQVNGHVPLAYLTYICERRAAFRPQGNKTSNQLVKDAIREAVENGVLALVPPATVLATYGSSPVVYARVV